ncbi:MAG: fibronectin type III domain-containing protein [Opitutaceae bacterium]
MAPIRNAFLARLIALTLAGATAVKAALWVSPGGDDRNPGTEEQPLKSIERARDVVRTLNRDMTDDITVFIGGTHRISRPIEFGPEDSATNGFSIVYTAAPGERPVVSGGLPVAGWNLSDRSRSLWWSPAPDGLVDSRELFVNGVPASRTRARLLQALVRNPSGVTVVSPEAKVQWRNPGDVEFPPPEPGAIWSERLGSPPFFAMNAFELLGTPGEWYFDRPARRIYYTPRAGEDMAAADAQVAGAWALIDGKGARGRPLSGLIFKGIRFECTTSRPPPASGAPGPQARGRPAAAVRFTLAGNIQFLEDDFVHMGTPGLDLGPDLDGATIEGCVFGDVAWSALRVADASQVRVSNCRFSYVATAHPGEGAIELWHAAAVVIEHDQIDHFPRFAIQEQAGQPGASRRAVNLISPPMIDYDGRPDGDSREAASADAGVSKAYQGILAERFCGPTVPRPPDRVSAEAGDGLAYVTWDPPCLDGGSTVASYTVISSDGARISVPSADFRARGYAVFSGLENGHAVNFTVAATNATGAGPPSLSTANIVPERRRRPKPPQPPVSASVEQRNGTLSVHITPPAADGGSPVLSYRFASMPSGKRIDLEGWDVIHAGASDPVVREISGYSLDPGSTIAISATNAVGEGKPVILTLQK